MQEGWMNDNQYTGVLLLREKAQYKLLNLAKWLWVWAA